MRFSLRHADTDVTYARATQCDEFNPPGDATIISVFPGSRLFLHYYHSN